MEYPANCTRCGQLLPPLSLVCSGCGALLHKRRLEELSLQAQSLEPTDPVAAAQVWRRCLDLLPPDSEQYQSIQQRAWTLLNARPPVVIPYATADAAQSETLGWGVLKTGISMLISIAFYSLIFGWKFATGFMLLTLIHELGHTLAIIRYGLKASAPIFIPTLGALINLRTPPPNAKVEAIVGIAGPLAGTLAALACYGYYLYSHNIMVLALANFGFFLNFFNLLPIPPLDGGRATAAVSPTIWLAGVAATIFSIIQDLRNHTGGSAQFMILILIFGLPRVIATFRNRARNSPYYQVSPAVSWTIGTLYVTLGVGLYLMLSISRQALQEGLRF